MPCGPLSIISHKHFLAKSTSNCSRSMVDTVLMACQTFQRSGDFAAKTKRTKRLDRLACLACFRLGTVLQVHCKHIFEHSYFGFANSPRRFRTCFCPPRRPEPQWKARRASTKTPRSIFITVRDPKRMKNNIRIAMIQLSCDCNQLRWFDKAVFSKSYRGFPPQMAPLAAVPIELYSDGLQMEPFNKFNYL